MWKRKKVGRERLINNDNLLYCLSYGLIAKKIGFREFINSNKNYSYQVSQNLDILPKIYNLDLLYDRDLSRNQLTIHKFLPW